MRVALSRNRTNGPAGSRTKRLAPKLIDEGRQVAHRFMNVDGAVMAGARQGAQISTGVKDRQFLLFDMALEVPAYGGSLFEYVQWPFVGCDEDAFFAARQTRGEEL